MLLYQTVKPNSKEQPGLTGLCCVASAPYPDPSEPQRLPPCELACTRHVATQSFSLRLPPPPPSHMLLPVCAPSALPRAADGKWLAFDLRLEEVRCACCGPAVHAMARCARTVQMAALHISVLAHADGAMH